METPVHASDLQVGIPMVDRHTSALTAARLIAKRHFAGLVIADEHGNPIATLSAVDVLRVMVPGYIRDDMSLAGVFDERGAEEVWEHLDGRTIGELLDDDGVNLFDLLRVDADATLVEIAAQMAEARVLVALVAGTEKDTPAFVTLPSVMEAILSFYATDKNAENKA